MNTREEYFSKDNNMKYFSATQFKSFLECEDKALAELTGEYEHDKIDAFLQGNYFDTFFDGTREEFEKNNKVFDSKGKMYEKFQKVLNAYERASKDELWMMFAASGKQELPMTGSIEGVPFKIRIDSYHEGKAIADRKLMANMTEMWSAEERRYVSFIKAYKYSVSAAIYQEIVRQNSGLILPYYLVIATKEKEPELRIVQIDQSVMDNSMIVVKENISRFAAIKRGEIEPRKCGKCDWCKRNKKAEIELYTEE